MSRVYLVRHARHDLVDRALAGRTPGVHLSSEGREQAARLADHFAAVPVEQIVSSPLERCLETARPIADRLGATVQVDLALNEIDCGIWTGRAFSELASDPDWHAWNTERAKTVIPAGESMRQVQGRVMPLIERLAAHNGGAAVLVSHGDVLKAVVLTLVGSSFDRYDRIVVDPASITTLDLWPSGGKVFRLNEEARP